PTQFAPRRPRTGSAPPSTPQSRPVSWFRRWCTSRIRRTRNTLERLAQLHARTNQFNMTSPRRTHEELAVLAAKPNWTVPAFRVIYHGAELADEIIGSAEIEYEADGAARLDSCLARCPLLWGGPQ